MIVDSRADREQRICRVVAGLQRRRICAFKLDCFPLFNDTRGPLLLCNAKLNDRSRVRERGEMRSRHALTSVLFIVWPSQTCLP